MIYTIKYDGGMAFTNNADSMLKMIGITMTNFFEADTFLKFCELFESSTGYKVLTYIQNKIDNGQDVSRLLDLIRWSEMDVGESKFSKYDDWYFDAVRNALPAQVLQYKKAGIIVKEAAG